MSRVMGLRLCCILGVSKHEETRLYLLRMEGEEIHCRLCIFDLRLGRDWMSVLNAKWLPTSMTFIIWIWLCCGNPGTSLGMYFLECVRYWNVFLKQICCTFIWIAIIYASLPPADMFPTEVHIHCWHPRVDGLTWPCRRCEGCGGFRVSILSNLHLVP